MTEMRGNSPVNVMKAEGAGNNRLPGSGSICGKQNRVNISHPRPFVRTEGKQKISFIAEIVGKAQIGQAIISAGERPEVPWCSDLDENVGLSG